MSKKLNKISGRKGEVLAATFLAKRGYKIIQTNFSTRFGEIDIIAEKGQTTHIVEVRLRRGIFYGTPEESLTFKKLKKLKYITLFYLNRFKDLKLFEVEFISIVLSGGSGTIKKYNITEMVMS